MFEFGKVVRVKSMGGGDVKGKSCRLLSSSSSCSNSALQCCLAPFLVDWQVVMMKQIVVLVLVVELGGDDA